MTLQQDVETYSSRASEIAKRVVASGRGDGTIADFVNEADRRLVASRIRAEVRIPPSFGQVGDAEKLADVLCTNAYERAMERPKGGG